MHLLYSNILRTLFILCCIYGMTDECEEKYKYIYNLTKPYKFIQLTQILLLLLIFLHSISVFEINIPVEFRSFMKYLRKVLMVNALGISFCVFLGYWSLYLSDPENVVVKELVALGYRPSLLKNNAQHTLPFLFALYEAFQIEGDPNLCILLIPSSVIYYLFSFYFYKLSGRWQYGIFDNLGNSARIIFFIEFTILSMFYVYLIHTIKHHISIKYS
ncbi:hypothetical protein H312_02248 [Anncaliia algerae PRA339]|uniref:Uncharacterized protein n=1 Tax=Anncaliia algerae PRA339 TaxID=1288291 RepID=A0A059F026_9MICR|nr:hypothetical protein H312_02248 [Anncaliia algerae PRA339]